MVLGGLCATRIVCLGKRSIDGGGSRTVFEARRLCVLEKRKERIPGDEHVVLPLCVAYSDSVIC